MSDPAGVRVEPVTAWLVANVPGARAPFTFRQIAGGHSNLTYLVTDAGGRRVVLRRPPLGSVLSSAHDMGREHRIIHALAGTDVPVAPTFGLCADPDVTDAPFYVMDFVDGLVVRDAEAAAQLTEAQRGIASESIVDTMAKIHAVDVDAVGLGELGKKTDYISRQLKRWYGQWQQQHTRELPGIHRVHDELSRRIPEQGPATIVHGDYRLDNCMVGPDGNVVAVLDWEICTLGDPLADLGLLQVYWTGPNDTGWAWESTATKTPGFMDRAQLADRYAAVTGRSLDNLGFYVSFAFWKLACILEGVYSRYLEGALGVRDTAELAPFAVQVESAVQRAEEALE